MSCRSYTCVIQFWGGFLKVVLVGGDVLGGLVRMLLIGFLLLGTFRVHCLDGRGWDERCPFSSERLRVLGVSVIFRGLKTSPASLNYYSEITRTCTRVC